jgi:hypothetical protein
VTINSFDPASPRYNTWLHENFSGGGRSLLAPSAVGSL